MTGTFALDFRKASSRMDAQILARAIVLSVAAFEYLTADGSAEQHRDDQGSGTDRRCRKSQQSGEGTVTSEWPQTRAWNNMNLRLKLPR